MLGSFGAGRRQVQILNRHDDCCSGVAQHRGPVPYDDAVRAYQRQLQDRVETLGASAFRLEIDETAPGHQISLHAAPSLILPELEVVRTQEAAAGQVRD